MSSLGPIFQPSGQTRLGDFLIANLNEMKWTQFRAGIAFVKRSGVDHIRVALASFAQRAQVKMSFGVDHQVTTREGVQMLMDAMVGNGELWVFHNRNSSTFHPKLYLFRNTTEAVIAVGSGNLTEGGLFTNYEAGARVPLDLSNDRDRAILAAFETELDRWSDASQGLAKRVTAQELARLIDHGYLPSEAQARQAQKKGPQAEGDSGEGKPPLFPIVPVEKAPSRPRSRPGARGGRAAAGGREVAAVEGVSVFVMTLQRTDVGRGQTHSGAGRRSPEIFIPLVARDYAPAFWGWPASFVEDGRRPGKMDRRGVRMRLAGEVIEVNMMTWPAKRDFRLRSERLRSSGNVGDILRIERTDGRAGFEYYAEIVPPGTTSFETYRRACAEPVRNSQKRWGYF